MPRALFVLIVVGISIFAGVYFLLNLSKPRDDPADEPPVASVPAPIERSLSPTPNPAPASPPARSEGSDRAMTPVPAPQPLPPRTDGSNRAKAPIPAPQPPPPRTDGSDRADAPIPAPQPTSPRTEAPDRAKAPIPEPAPYDAQDAERIGELRPLPSAEDAIDTALSDRSDDRAGERAGETPQASRAEAIRHIEDLIDPLEKPIPVDEAEHFVTAKRILSLIPQEDIERLSLSEMKADEDMAPDTPLTVVHDIEQSERVSSQALLAEHEGDLETQVEVIEDDGVESISVAEALERMERADADSIALMRTERHFEVTTLEELQSVIDDADETISVVRKPYRLEKAELSLLIGKENEENGDAVFYIHTVQDRDIDGIWGIIHRGLIDNFAAGMDIEREGKSLRYRVDIPVHSDELLQDRSSSFLGKFIDAKVRESIVYNFEEHRIGKNPDRIHPGQEILIVEFQAEELIDLYRYFAGAGAGED
ncbi:MAG: hypothetical protein ISN28_05235 [Ectothiorhodospiraceae bacterium AqS1]|nr:hypothetical protein [Ectothiorhodospiraceae bacterium AqS1]MBF2759656.1 hypothetical protein [Ectothiorhodospiraceae bacterium AqS1]